MKQNEYRAFIANLMNTGFDRVERDDRLLDIFKQEILEKGIELWERWDATTVTLVRIHLPNTIPQWFSIPRITLEKFLGNNKPQFLDTYIQKKPLGF